MSVFTLQKSSSTNHGPEASLAAEYNNYNVLRRHVLDNQNLNYQTMHPNGNPYYARGWDKGTMILSQSFIDTPDIYFNRYYNRPEDARKARSYTSVKLKDSLIMGNAYHFSFWIVPMTLSKCPAIQENTPDPTWAYSDDIGVALSTNKPVQIKANKMEMKTVWRTPKIIDEVCWQKLEFSFIADSNYKYLTIGCFVDNKDINFTLDDSISRYYWDRYSEFKRYYSVYHIDDVSLIDTVLHPTIVGQSVVCQQGNQIYHSKVINKYAQWFVDGKLVKTGDSISVFVDKNTQIVLAYGGEFDTLEVTFVQAPAYTLNDTVRQQNEIITITNPNLGFNYLWDNTPTDTLRQKNYNSFGNKWVRLEKSGCIFIDSFNIDSIDLSFFIVSPSIKVCEKDSLQISTNKPYRNYKWYVNNQLQLTDNTFTFYTTTAGKYTFIAQFDTLNRQIYDTLQITVLPIPSSNLPTKIEECTPLNYPICFEFNQANISYLWNNKVVDSCISIKQPGTYTLFMQNEGCTHTETITVIENPNPIYSIIQLDTVCFDGNNSSYLTILPDSFAQYTWLPSMITGNTLQIFNDKKLSVTVLNTKGCSITKNIIPKTNCKLAVFIPNSFTPNVDGRNDVFGIVGTQIGSVHWQIFSVWGEMIFEANDMLSTWDGTYLGKPVPQGNYAVVAKIRGIADGSGAAERKVVYQWIMLLR